MDINKQREDQLKMIAHAFKITPEVRYAHPWIQPMWDEIQHLREQLTNTPKPDVEQVKTATQILAERKAAELSDKDVEKLLDTPKKPKRTRKAKTDEEGQG